jgi:hypothetical protein
MKTVVFAVSYGRGMGTGSLMRECTLASAAKRMGYRTVLVAQRAAEESLPGKLSERVRGSFDEWIAPVGLFATTGELSGLSEVAAVIMDDYRQAGKRPEAIASLKALGGTFAIVDGMDALEFEEADKIINIELGLTDRVKAFRNKLIHGAQYTLIPQEFFEKMPLKEPLPAGKSCLFYFGSTDPFNISAQAIRSIKGLGYVPILFASKSSPYTASLQEALYGFDDYLWIDSRLTRGQMNTLWGSVSVGVMGPASNAARYALHNRCPIIGIPTNPTLLTNTLALKEMGLPIVMLDKARVEANYGKDAEVLFPEIKTELPKALKALEAAGYIDGRLPNRPPFDVQLTAKGPENILEALGLACVADTATTIL